VRRSSVRLQRIAATALLCGSIASLAAQQPTPPQQPTPTPAPAQAPAPAPSGNGTAAAPGQPEVPAGITPPADYVIGADDVLTVIFWREKDMSADVGVRPDGKISLPLLNEVPAAGLTPEQLRLNLTQLAGKYIEEPTVTVVVKQINSRRVFITGQVSKPGPYPLIGALTVMQLITVAGGVLEYANTENISIVRTTNGKPTRFRFNYKEYAKGKNLLQNIDLKPGDQVIIP
jgi:polysaccharide export outer membrane protein